MTLAGFLAKRLALPADPHVQRLATILADDDATLAVLFYGSNLRGGSLDGVLDFYVLQAGPRERGIWPRVSYREVTVEGVLLRAKIATMRLSTFRAAAASQTVDTTIWARFVQPALLLWTKDAGATRETVDAIAGAAVTASRHAAALGPATGTPADYWRALFTATYAAEFRVEQGRADVLVERNHDYYAALLPLAWAAAAVPFETQGEGVRTALPSGERRRIHRGWTLRRLAGRPLNVVRLLRATTTFEGAARYAAWKIERHTGAHIDLTPWQERHPVLAAPGVLWRVRRQRAR